MLSEQDAKTRAALLIGTAGNLAGGDLLLKSFVNEARGWVWGQFYDQSMCCDGLNVALILLAVCDLVADGELVLRK